MGSGSMSRVADAAYGHSRRFTMQIAQRAVRCIRGAGATVCCQVPPIHYVNDDAEAWAELWRRQTRATLTVDGDARLDRRSARQVP